ncbi:unnamed protein product [Effrenium voratum]|nr:unnamed protein product [Effrenium voratum]
MPDWDASVGHFWQVAPVSMQQSELVATAEKQTASRVAVAAEGRRTGGEGRPTWGSSSPKART